MNICVKCGDILNTKSEGFLESNQCVFTVSRAWNLMCTYQHARLDLHRCSLDAILLHFACFALISNNTAVRIEKKRIRGHSYIQKLASDVFD
jgi:hypothetical protein